jgi:hypothetical protein
LGGSGHTKVIAAQCLFDVVKGIADLRRQSLAVHALNDVLILSLGELHAAAERLPQPDRRNVNRSRFVSHDVFDSAGAILLHDTFRKSKLPSVIYMLFVAKSLC